MIHYGILGVNTFTSLARIPLTLTQNHISLCVCVINFVHASLSIAYWDLFPGNKLLCQPSHENCLHRSKIESKSLSDAVQNMQHACVSCCLHRLCAAKYFKCLFDSLKQACIEISETHQFNRIHCSIVCDLSALSNLSICVYEITDQHFMIAANSFNIIVLFNYWLYVRNKTNSYNRCFFEVRLCPFEIHFTHLIPSRARAREQYQQAIKYA